MVARMTDETVHGRLLVSVMGGAWMLPEGYRPKGLGVCRGCNQEILWAVTTAGKNSPHDPDGTSHFATCPQAQRFRDRQKAEKKLPDIPCATCGKPPTGTYHDGSPRYSCGPHAPIFPDVANDRL